MHFFNLKYFKIYIALFGVVALFCVQHFFRSNLNNQPALTISDAKNRDEMYHFFKLDQSSEGHLNLGDLTVGRSQKLQLKNDVIDSDSIKNKSIKNKDVASEAIDSRAIKNGSIAVRDIDAGTANGFLRNIDGSLNWDSLSLSDISLPTIGNPTVMNQLATAFDYMWSSGVISGGDITDNGNGTVNISSGEAMLRTSNSDTAPLESLTFPGKSNISLVNNTTNYLFASYNDGHPEVETSTIITDFNCLDKCHLYTIVREDDQLTILDGRFQNIDANRKQRRKNYETEPFMHVTGGTVLGSDGINLTVSPGAFYYSLSKINHNAFDTSQSGNGPDRVLEYYYRDGSGGWKENLNLKQLDIFNYDDGSGTLVSAQGGQYVVNWVYMLLGETPRLAVMYGRSYYTDQASAEAEGTPRELPPSISGAGVLIGEVVIQVSFNATEVISAFNTTFNSGGNTSLSSLTGLGDDALKQYALLAGRDGGQILTGGNTSNDALTIQGNSASGNLATNPNLIFNVGNSGGTQAITVLNNGNMGIGIADPGSYKLYINGSGYLNDSTWTYASDRRLKENIVSLSDNISIIDKLNPVQFDYISGKKNQFGFIAQDVQKILPSLVEERPDGMLGLRTDSFLPIAIGAIQEQEAKIETLEQKIDMNVNQYSDSSLDTLPAGDIKKTIKTGLADEKNLIFVTINKADHAVPIMTGNIKKGESFDVLINAPEENDIKFSWRIIKNNNQ